ncbi:methyltransferase domain-containing protein [Candidatus Pacearchaeota archaeon]|nr:methyltransferase domain-containing protein [Candidatus Pacearchaeota archaeon]
MIIPKQAATEFLGNLNPHSVLDLGCGKGMLSLNFARKGIKVTGVDKKPQTINQDNFAFEQSDIRNFSFSKSYDLIISSFVLHFLKKEEAERVINKMITHTSFGGYNLLICMSDKNELYKNKPLNFYPSLKCLKDIYSGWEVVKCISDYTPLEEHDNLSAHRHHIILLLIKKPAD